MAQTGRSSNYNGESSRNSDKDLRGRFSLHEPQGRARLRRADFTAGGGASTASVSAAWFAEYAHCGRLAALERGLDGVSPYRELMASTRDSGIVEA